MTTVQRVLDEAWSVACGGVIAYREHTIYQPADEEWGCPKCGEQDYFYILGDKDCKLLHVDDCVRCVACESEFSGQEVADRRAKKLSLL